MRDGPWQPIGRTGKLQKYFKSLRQADCNNQDEAGNADKKR